MQTVISSDVNQACKFLLEGELVAIPTETVYGLAANALNPETVLKIFAAKQRPSFNPLIVHLHSMTQVYQLATNIPPQLLALMQTLWPGPLTVLVEKQTSIPDIVTSGSTKVGLRMPSHTLTQQLLSALPFPLAAPSANLFGYVSPTSAQHVYEGLKGKIAMVLDGGVCAVGLESTVVDYDSGKIIIRRNGGISREIIEKITGEKVMSETSADKHPVAPGMLKSHYATNKPLYFLEQHENFPAFKNSKVGVIGWGTEEEVQKLLDTKEGKIRSLSLTKNIDEAGANLFALLREFDSDEEVDLLIALPVPSSGIGIAINDRLRRADYRNKH